MKKDKQAILDRCNATSKNTLMETLQIEYTDVGEDYLVGRMPVDEKVHQPDGVLHGGAMVALAESVGSMASYLFLNTEDFFVRGIEISANHVRSIKEGEVYARAGMLHQGRTTQLWQIRLTDTEGRLISVCKLTTIALPKKKD
ncbi:PaaI family thioesterase [Sinomicrobium weinanense]|uniref:Hotdog fold thioesterase n=1 Tax=Sinomicrobium weinanense TaxID=2842200 RepID=A0A926JUB8_9FLAO|nr:hotdog fold thioesterase [Sinomicrobium weinanense]MBC9797521.1 hotdog fold thioesterase [Sinomicrobium weinanense]MBU3122380.1 hotdog fold thioesterase [Sinomicrobium weinanense]